MRRAFSFILMIVFSGCGYLSNDPYWTRGEVRGQIVADSGPLAGAQVLIVGEDEHVAITDDNGSFAIGGLSGYHKTLSVIWGQSLGIQEEFDLTGQEIIDLGTLNLVAVGMVAGKVDVDSPERVEVVVKGTPIVTHPDSAGLYKIALPEGEWDVELRATGYVGQEIDGQKIVSGEVKQIDSITLSVDPNHSCDESEAIVDSYTQGGAGAVDALFIVDNSRSMVGEQKALADSFSDFVAVLEEGAVNYHIGVITTGMESEDCKACPPDDEHFFSCINETGESGRFQDRLGHNQGTDDEPQFDFVSDPTCRQVTEENLDCFYDRTWDKGTVLVGTNGCGYERGLAAMQMALGGLSASYNSGFLRPWARLAVIVVSDEEDCGEVGDVTEGITGIRGSICYYAAKGIDPQGNISDPQYGRPYSLTSIEHYRSFLESLKPVPLLATFSAIVGVSDPSDPSSTEIHYTLDDESGRWQVSTACSVPGCSGEYCQALPGTRYIKLAQATGGSIESICQENYSQPLLNVVGASVGYTNRFHLSRKPISQDTLKVSINGKEQKTGFGYDEQRRDVVFEHGHVPPPYSLVTIEYEAACQ